MTTTTVLSYDEIINELYQNYIESKMQKDVFNGFLVSSKESFDRLLVNVYSYCTLESQLKFIILCLGSTTCKNILKGERQISGEKKSTTDIICHFMVLLNKYPNAKVLFLNPINNNKKLFKLQTNGKPLLDAANRWGPVSDAGLIYEFDRGVIAIKKNGETIKKPLDYDTPHHHLATWCIINNQSLIYPDNVDERDKFWKLYDEAIRKGPVEIGIDGAEKGWVIFQLEGDCITSFIPTDMNLEQLYSLLIVLAPRKKFNISFWHDGEIHENTEVIDYIDVNYFEKYCINCVLEGNRTRRTV